MAARDFLGSLLYVRENEFRAGYLKACTKRIASEAYSNHLMFAVMTDLENGKYDAAIQAAFKTLDAHLQLMRILKLTGERTRRDVDQQGIRSG